MSGRLDSWITLSNWLLAVLVLCIYCGWANLIPPGFFCTYTDMSGLRCVVLGSE